MRSLWCDSQLRFITFFSLAVTLAGCFILIVFATERGFDPTVLTGDSRGYVLLAENLLAYSVFSVAPEPPWYPESFRTPGYPAFLALLFAVFRIPLLVLIVHAALTALAPVLLYLFARTFHERAAFWTAIIFALEPVRIFLSSSLLSDAFFTTLFLGSLVLLENVRREGSWYLGALTGLLVGFIILVRPIAILLPLFYGAYLLISLRPIRQGVQTTLILGACSLIVVFPWIYRNHRVFDSWVISSVGAVNLVLYNAPEYLKSFPDARGKAILDNFRAEYETLPREEGLSLVRSDTYTETFRDIIRGHEGSYIAFHVFKTIPFFVTDGLRDIVRLLGIDIGIMPNISSAFLHGDIEALFSYLRAGGLATLLFLVGVTFWSVIALLFLVAVIRALRRRDLPMIFIVLLVMYFALLTGPVSSARYRVPVEGLMIFAAVMVCSRWYDARHVV